MKKRFIVGLLLALGLFSATAEAQKQKRDYFDPEVSPSIRTVFGTVPGVVASGRRQLVDVSATGALNHQVVWSSSATSTGITVLIEAGTGTTFATITNSTASSGSSTFTGAYRTIGLTITVSDVDVDATYTGSATVSAKVSSTAPVANQVAYWTDTYTIGGDAGLTYAPSTDVLSLAAAVAVGTNPSLTGAFRSPNADGVYFRNAANNANLQGLVVTSADAITLGAGNAFSGMEFDVLSGGVIVLNQQSGDVDVRVESDTNANALILDAGAFTGVGAISQGAAALTTSYNAIQRPALTAGSNLNYFDFNVAPAGAVTIAAATTSAAVATVNFEEPNITATGSVTRASTVRIVAAPTEGVTNSALDVVAGAARFGGTAFFPGAPAGAAGDEAACLNTTTDELTDAGATGCIVSSVRYKENVEDHPPSLPSVMNLRPVIYNYKPELDSSAVKGKRRIGLIAEEVESVFPLLVSYEPDGVTPRTVSYQELTAVLVKAIQEQQEQIANLAERVRALEHR